MRRTIYGNECGTKKSQACVVPAERRQKAARVGSLWPSAATYRDGNGPANRNPLCSIMYSSTTRKARENSQQLRVYEDMIRMIKIE